MMEALKALKVEVRSNTSFVEVTGKGGPFDEGLNELTLNLGNAGTAMRPLCAALAVSDGVFTLTGEPRMFERPIGPLIEALKSMGCNIEYLNNDGFPPVQIRGSRVKKHQVTIDGSTSSQFISALLMAAPICGGLEINVQGDLISKPYVDLTISLIEKFGAKVKRNGYNTFTVDGGGYASPEVYLIESDATSATYFAAAAAINGELELFGLPLDSVQGDFRFFEVLKSMGAKVSYSEHAVTVKSGTLKGIEIDMNAMPDAAMTLVPLSLYTKEEIVIKNIASWRVKETDRIEAMATQMRKLGVKVQCGDDYIALDASSTNEESPVFDTYNDHRMAMCMSLVAFNRDIVINNPEVINKTFPTYFNLLNTVIKR
jgi:3-phosphoshikimate 1-carboxyvinyltransferase